MRSVFVHPTAWSCASIQSTASRFRCVPCRRSPNCVNPLMVALYCSRSSRLTSERTGSAVSALCPSTTLPAPRPAASSTPAATCARFARIAPPPGRPSAWPGRFGPARWRRHDRPRKRPALALDPPTEDTAWPRTPGSIAKSRTLADAPTILDAIIPWSCVVTKRMCEHRLHAVRLQRVQVPSR